MWGVNHMSTEDIFAYFKVYPPLHAEWVDDRRANVVWKDDSSALRSLIYMTLPDIESSAVISSIKKEQNRAKVKKEKPGGAMNDDTFSLNSDSDNHEDMEIKQIIMAADEDSGKEDDVLITAIQPATGLTAVALEEGELNCSGDSEEEKNYARRLLAAW